MMQSGRKLVTYGDDGEKFGSWPGTFKWVYEDGWLESFLCKLENSDFINILLPKEAAELHSPRRTIYLPCASYEEMGEWTLPAEAQVDLHHLKEELAQAGLKERVIPYIRGGFWRQFLAKYGESGGLYNRMLRVSDKTAALKRKRKIEPQLLEQAERCLFKGQANDAYWHGVFGGVYLPHLRSAVEKHLILAETICDRELRDYSQPDKYNPHAVTLQNHLLRVQIQPDKGGAVAAVDIRQAGFNIVNIMSRSREPYHTRLLEAAAKGKKQDDSHASIHDRLVVKEEGLTEKLATDKYSRYCFIDRFIKRNFTLEDLQYNRAVELGDFAGAAYQVDNTAGNKVCMSRQGTAGGIPLILNKFITLDEENLSLLAEYRLQGKLNKISDCLFAPELNINFLAPCSADRFFLINGERFTGNNLGGGGDRADVRLFSLIDDWLGVRVDLSASRPARWVWHPVETISLSEEGIERVYQGSAVLPMFKLEELTDGMLTVKMSIEYWKRIL